MFITIIEITIGLIVGIILGITGLAATSIILLIMSLLKIGNYKTNLGSVLFIQLFPITIGSIYEFYKVKKIDFQLSIILLFSVMFGSMIGSKLVLNKENPLSEKIIDYITSAVGFIIGISFFISGYYK